MSIDPTWRADIPLDDNNRPHGPFEIQGWALIDEYGQPIYISPFHDLSIIKISPDQAIESVRCLINIQLEDIKNEEDEDDE